MIDPVRKEITVNCDAQTAFDTFARNISSWWPKDKHSVSAMNGKVAQNVILDPQTGGRIYEIAHDGAELDWGSVKEFEDGKRLVLNWHINAPASEATEVEVSFSSRDDGKTDVVLIHRNFEVLGDNGPGMRDGYNNGWVNVFENHFAGACG